MAVLLDCDFTTLADASTWPLASFKQLQATVDAPTAPIVSGAGRLLAGSATNYTDGLAIAVRAKRTDNFGLYFKAKFISGGDSYPGLTFLGSETYGGGATPNDCYILQFGKAANAYSLIRRQTSSNTTLATVTQTMTNGTTVCGRLIVTGSLIRARMWTDGTTEPTTWPIRAADTLLARQGRLAFVMAGGNTASATLDYKRIVLTDDVYTAEVTSGSGKATLSGDGATTAFNIPHGLSVTPSVATVTAGSAAASGSFYVTTTSTNVVVTYAAAPASGSGNVILNWRAEI